MQHLKVSGAVRPLYSTLGVKRLILFPHLRLGLSSGPLPTDFPIKIPYAPLFSSIRATRSAHFSVLDLITLIKFG